MDPRLKLDFYKEDKNSSAENNPEEIDSYVKSFYDRDYAPNGGSISPDLPHKEQIYSTSFSRMTALNQILKFISPNQSLKIIRNSNVLDYWKNNSARFPNLSRMARDYLAVPGTSTPSERAFSGGRQLITDFRYEKPLGVLRML